ncbi:histidine phosphatase family protein [Rhabdothermincola salaria]|uniref:histidine phosphatase family protein n=1 Tax=Rhabdothermincola salaria TaxID=2903142 RepID=UPI001E5D9452|nr:histidine phosphatase family protein [Rhabdothermincola salaria]MCD9622410.1 histidine phosphatase family protein [Rhabdothermincola salaria]
MSNGAESSSRQVLLVRHGETEDNVRGRFLGRGDPPLNGRGRCQARQLAPVLASFAPEVLVTSPARRAAETLVEAAGGHHPVLDDAFREVDFGRWEGRTRDEVAALDPSDHERFASGAVSGFPGGDRVADIADRAGGALDRYPGDRLVIVTHATTIRILVASLLGIPVEHYRLRLARPGNGSWSRLEHAAGGWRLVAYGVVPGTGRDAGEGGEP